MVALHMFKAYFSKFFRKKSISSGDLPTDNFVHRNLPSFGSHRGPKSVATPQILDACDNPQTLRYSQRSLGPDCA